jgi:4-hydroxybenzoyl-CoA thioesterase/acyl-CoA thioester hydrolase
MPAAFHTTRRVEFADTDAAGIAHFAAFFRWMEEAEHEFWRSLGLNVVLPDEAGQITWPRVHADCDYRSPARFEDVLEIEVSVASLTGKSVTFGFRFAIGERELATGALTAVCCRFAPECGPRSMAIPDSIRQRLSELAPPA